MYSFFSLLIFHFLGDYTFQSLSLSEKKKESIRHVIIHSLIYTLLTFLAIILYGEIFEIIIFSIIIFITHFLIDVIRINLDKKVNSTKFSLYSFIVDQALHIIVLFIIGLVLVSLNDFGRSVIQDINSLEIIDLSNIRVIKIIFAYILILSPSSIFIKHLLNYFFTDNKDNQLCEEEQSKAGSIIGKLERLVILTLGIMGLFSSIAIVITAKSLARFKQLENKEFAEKYLVGTLTSVLIAIICILILK